MPYVKEIRKKSIKAEYLNIPAFFGDLNEYNLRTL